MRKKTMMKAIILFIGLFVGGASILPSISMASMQTNDDSVNSTPESTQDVSVSIQTTGDITTIHYTLGTFSMTPITINNQKYTRISLGEEPSSLIAGAPDLPSVPRSIIIPNAMTMGIRVIAVQYEEYPNVLVAPSKGNLPRTINPADVPYEFGEVYTQNTWYPAELAQLREPYILRDFRGQVVTIYPFQYNPGQATLRFYNDITIQVFPIGQELVSSLALTQQPSKIDSDFKAIYEHHFINYNQLRYDPVPEQGNMLVITYDDFYDEMVPFVQWKNLKGIPTEMVNVSTIGNANAIKTYINTYYNTNGLTFVLLVGDAAQVPTITSGGFASDPGYSFIVGSDHYSDLFVGRFSAENAAQAQTQIDRSVAYEREPQIGADWYKKGVGIASNQGPGDDNEMDYEHIRNIRTKLLALTYTLVDELYDGSQGGQDAAGDPTPTMVATSLNNGRSIINYCGHGSPTSWGTSGFSNSNVNTLTNDNMLPFITSVACNNGEFNDYTCFAEAWLRATHNGQPTGAIGAFMSSISQSWDPPMAAQDEFNDLFLGTYPDNKKTTYGALCFTGCMYMNDQYGSAGYGETDAWTVFGDPSLQIRTDAPSTMTVDHGVFVEYGATTFELDVPGVPGALCAISHDYKTLGYGLTDAAGHAIIEFFEPLAADGSVDLVVTGFNKIPYITILSVGEPNHSPLIPEKPQGPASVKPGISYMYRTSTTDSDGDTISYMWDWGDGNFSEWIGPFSSGQTASATHTWDARGSYAVRVKAKDARGAQTDWSEPLDITVPTSSFLVFFVQQHFPRLAHFIELLQQVLQ